MCTDFRSEGIISRAKELGLPTIIGRPKTEEIDELGQINFGLSINYLFLLNKDVISKFERGCFNIHGSLLPKYRGRTPHVWAIINGETEAGATLHLIDEGCDTGDILFQERVSISKNLSGNDLLLKYEELYPKLLLKLKTAMEENNLKLIKQIEEEASFFPKRTPDDGGIDWNWECERIRNWVRAQRFPYPGAFSHFGDNKIIIDEVSHVSEEVAGDVGEVVGFNEQQCPIVQAKDGQLALIVIRNKDEIGLKIHNKLV